MTTSPGMIVDLLQRGFPKEQHSLYRELIEKTARDFSDAQLKGEVQAFADPSFLPVSLVDHLVRHVDEDIEQIRHIRQLAAEFQQRVVKAGNKEEVQEQILLLASELGASSRDLAKDRRAFKRWFAQDAILERCNKRVGECEYRVVFYLSCLQPMAIEAMGSAGSENNAKRLWQRLNLERLLEVILAYVGDKRLRVAVFRCLALTLQTMPPAVTVTAVKDSTLHFIYRAALESRQLVWIQTESLRLLAALSVESLVKALNIRLSDPQGEDDLFVRHQAVLLIRDALPRHRQLIDFLPLIIKDPSPFVRQVAGEVIEQGLLLPGFSDKRNELYDLLNTLLLEDEAEQVRAATLLTFPRLVKNPDLCPALTAMMGIVLGRELNSFVLRTALQSCRNIFLVLEQEGAVAAGHFFQATLPFLESLHREATDLSVRRWAGQAINFAKVQMDPLMARLFYRLEEALLPIRLGRGKKLPQSWFQQLDEEQVGQVLALLAEKSGSLTLRPGRFSFLLLKGDSFDFRWWRFFHELRNPTPDKRQAYSHTLGRVYRGRIHAPSPIMAELTETKVPGEPLLQGSEAGWRPYLPLVDQLTGLLVGLFPGTPLRIYTAEGITKVSPPITLGARLRSRLHLTFRFRQLADLRNWQEKSTEPPDSFVRRIEKLGFRVQFMGYRKGKGEERHEADPAVARFFAGLPILFDPALLGKIKDYVFSVYENSLYELGIFVCAMLLFFFGLRLVTSFAVRKARKKLLLVVGGWGTRGKSGVERLKAALFESLGHSILSKSTGCEAMFLHSHPFGRTQEMFLFRSYDKATIWEHHSLLLMAAEMKSSVFLWECMGLTPSYVEILQHKWSRDDFSTITNTYPDHEDIQGPAGYNIPQVMTCFIPEKGTLLTSEEQMYPILAEDARQKQSAFQRVGWLEAGLLTPDILERFPYQEHPYNIALVLALAERLAIKSDFALKEMADRVIPDIGVLKAFPKSALRSRLLEFVNGMSANERYATLSNWKRMSFETGPDGPDPGVVLHVLVNNRADRISRSRMFASILVEDIMADRYILIGSNLTGLSGYIGEAWERHLAGVLAEPSQGSHGCLPADLIDSMASRLRIPMGEEFIRQRLALMLAPLAEETKIPALLELWERPEELQAGLAGGDSGVVQELLDHLREHRELHGQYRTIHEKVRGKQALDAQLAGELAALFTGWFQCRIVIVEDFHATGDQIIDRICRETPPGLTNRIMGVQNIKGTGLDYVYRWQAWERCYAACRKVETDEEGICEEGLNEMIAFQDYGVLCEEYVRQSVTRAKLHSFAQTERFQDGLNLILGNMELAMKTVRKRMEGNTHSPGVGSRIIEAIEAFLDAGDAVKRRKTANRIYEDLVSARISQQRAALELQALNKRQKGGWLLKKLKTPLG